MKFAEEESQEIHELLTQLPGDQRHPGDTGPTLTSSAEQL